MGLLELFILAVGLSMDAFAVSVCKGLAMRRITFGKTLVVGLWFGGFQALMPAAGYFLGVQFREKITAVDHWIAFILLGLIGATDSLPFFCFMMISFLLFIYTILPFFFRQNFLFFFLCLI